MHCDSPWDILCFQILNCYHLEVLLFNNSFIGNVSVSWGGHRKFYTLGSLNNRNLFSHSSGGWKPEIQFQAGFSWGLCPCLEDGHLLPVLTSSSLCTYTSLCPNIFFQRHKSTVLRSAQQPHFNFVWSFKALSSNVAHSKVLGVRASTHKFFRGRNTIQPIRGS